MTARKRTAGRRERFGFTEHLLVTRCPAPWEPMDPADERRLRRVVEMHRDRLYDPPAPAFAAMIRCGIASADEVADYIDTARAEAERALAYLERPAHEPVDHEVEHRILLDLRTIDAPRSHVKSRYRQRLAALNAWAANQGATNDD